MSSTDEYRRFEILQHSMHYEGEVLWTRFTGFATLHAGLFVIATASSIQTRAIAGVIISVVGVVLAAVWIEIHRLSVRYADRWKPSYSKERDKLFPDVTDESLDPKFSSTDIASVVPWVVGFTWLLLLVVSVFQKT